MEGRRKRDRRAIREGSEDGKVVAGKDSIQGEHGIEYNTPPNRLQLSGALRIIPSGSPY